MSQAATPSPEIRSTKGENRMPVPRSNLKKRKPATRRDGANIDEAEQSFNRKNPSASRSAQIGRFHDSRAVFQHWIALVSTNSARPSSPHSRPLPDCL